MESGDEVSDFRKMYPEATVYSKVESKRGLDNFLEVAIASDGVLVDRGDLSHQVPLERIPLIQKYIANRLREMGKEVFIATNTLEQMAHNLKPNRAEVNDVVNTILDGATGIALTKETAVGKYPIGVVDMLKSLINELDNLGVVYGDTNTDIIRRIDSTKYLNS